MVPQDSREYANQGGRGPLFWAVEPNKVKRGPFIASTGVPVAVLEGRSDSGQGGCALWNIFGPHSSYI